MNIFKADTFEDRIKIVRAKDPEFANEIEEFFEHNPEFYIWGHMIPLLRHPIGYGLYPFEEKCEHHQRNFIEFLIYYICEAGVRAAYGAEQWEKMYPFLRRTNYDLMSMIEVFDKDIQPAKKKTYEQLHLFMITNEIKPTELNIDHISQLEEQVKGIGSGARAFLEQIFALDHGKNLVESTDIGFIKGFCIIYGYNYKTNKPTKAQIRDKIAEWGNCKSIGSKMCRQVYQNNF